MNNNSKTWFMLSQSAAEQLARNKKIGGAEYRVLFFSVVQNKL